MDIAVASFGFDIGGASYPAEAIGGDYYDFVSLPDGSLGLAVGDVSGHGVGPALLMAEVRAFLRAFAQTEPDVGAILGLMNRAPRAGHRRRPLRHATAGPPGPDAPPLQLRQRRPPARASFWTTRDRSGVNSAARAPHSAFSPKPRFPRCGDVELTPGDLVLLVTDGVMDARAPDGTRFGVQRTLDLVRVLPAGGGPRHRRKPLPRRPRLRPRPAAIRRHHGHGHQGDRPRPAVNGGGYESGLSVGERRSLRLSHRTSRSYGSHRSYRTNRDNSGGDPGCPRRKCGVSWARSGGLRPRRTSPLRSRRAP